MADYVIAADAVGVYEVPLAANTPLVFQFANQNPFAFVTANVMVNSAATPVYARQGTSVTVKDTRAQIVQAGFEIDVPLGYGQQLSVISATDATISVARS